MEKTCASMRDLSQVFKVGNNKTYATLTLFLSMHHGYGICAVFTTVNINC